MVVLLYIWLCCIYGCVVVYMVVLYIWLCCCIYGCVVVYMVVLLYPGLVPVENLSWTSFSARTGFVHLVKTWLSVPKKTLYS